jgi:hypothetical protein
VRADEAGAAGEENVTLNAHYEIVKLSSFVISKG